MKNIRKRVKREIRETSKTATMSRENVVLLKCTVSKKKDKEAYFLRKMSFAAE